MKETYKIHTNGADVALRVGVILKSKTCQLKGR